MAVRPEEDGGALVCAIGARKITEMIVQYCIRRGSITARLTIPKTAPNWENPKVVSQKMTSRVSAGTLIGFRATEKQESP
jgi:hypothetical protein